MTTSIVSSAPGSLMIMGEHAVLHGRASLVTSVSCRVKVHLTPRNDGRFVVCSALGDYGAPLADLKPVQPFSFVIEAVRAHASSLPGGMTLDIQSDFSSTVGLGSSAAVTVATHAALIAASGRALENRDVFEAALATIRTIQGMGSGADVAATVWGGTVFYVSEPREIRRLGHACPLTVVYSGGKIPTPEVVARVEQAREANPVTFERLFDAIHKGVQDACLAVDRGDWARLGGLLDEAHQHMQELGVSSPALDEIASGLRECTSIHGAKISGAGLGDCVIGLGHATLASDRYEQLDVDSSNEGVRIEEA